MNHQRVLSALVKLGLSTTDAQVYIHLAIEGPQKASNIAETLNLQEQQLYKVLENLKNKGIIDYTFENITLFFALPFDKALEILVKARLHEAEYIEQNRNGILSKWQKIIRDDSTNSVL